MGAEAGKFMSLRKRWGISFSCRDNRLAFTSPGELRIGFGGEGVGEVKPELGINLWGYDLIGLEGREVSPSGQFAITSQNASLEFVYSGKEVTVAGEIGPQIPKRWRRLVDLNAVLEGEVRVPVKIRDVSVQYGSSYAEEKIAGMARKVARLLGNDVPCPLCESRGETACRQCRDLGTVPCPRCNGTRQSICRTCDGRGKVSCNARDRCRGCGGEGRTSCGECRGRGWISVPGEVSCGSCGGSGSGPRRVVCPVCNGSGWSDGVPCPRYMEFEGGGSCGACGGTGRRTAWRREVCGSCGGTGRGGPCAACGGTGWEKCVLCSGSGNRPCGNCGGGGRVACDACNGLGRLTCWNCRGNAVRCPLCGGRGRIVR